MKVLYITNVPSPYRVDFFNELGRYCDLTVLYDRNKVKYREDGWLTFNSENYKAVFLKGVQVKNSLFSFEIVKYLNKKKYDIIVIGGYSTITGMIAIQYMKLKKIHFILNADGGLVKSEKGIVYRMKKYFISSASAWLSTGRNTTEYLIHYGATKERIYDYPFTSIWEKDILDYPITSEKKKNIKQLLDIKEDKIIISVGRFVKRKGYDVLLRAFDKVSKDVGLYIIGGKPTNEYLNIIDKLNLEKVHFIEFKDKKDLIDFYQASDLFVLPTRLDIWGLVINEAMAYGLPIVSTDKCVAAIEIVSDAENGFIVPVDDIDRLASSMNEILNNKDMRLGMSQMSIENIKKYTIENMTKVHIHIFRDVIGRNK